MIKWKLLYSCKANSAVFVEVTIGFDGHIAAPRGIGLTQSLPYLSPLSFMQTRTQHARTHIQKIKKIKIKHAFALNAPAGEDKLWFQSHISNAWNSGSNKRLATSSLWSSNRDLTRKNSKKDGESDGGRQQHGDGGISL